MPTLLVHHRSDGCYVTPLAGARRLLTGLAGVTVKELIEIEGVGPPEGPACEGHHDHGFIGKESGTVKIVANWIKSHA